MSFISEIFTGTIDRVIDSAGTAIDKIFTSDEEKIKANTLLEKVKNELTVELGRQALEYDREVTKRWQSDNENFVTRLVRPGIVIWAYTLFTAAMLADGNIGDFKINEAYLPMLEAIILTLSIAYFGSRGAEKITKFIKKG